MSLEAKLTQLKNKMNDEPKYYDGMTSSFVFKITDLEEIWSVDFNGNHVELFNHKLESPTCILKMDSNHFNKLLEGNLNATTAFMMGKIKAEGDLSKALKLQKILTNYQ
ncbi:SCP2 sterol-binding domain-containing protein [Piscibacillus salipiscarius]|uniref:SCP2 sterol-binding domain-containing protein n=1 Tax=Piscibacillus salipiscarius TaxID=299480 RepID=A0ABW5Q652_9BACI|nr:SCP2 sterol-binding domain-containing protein [Piscibacillus salipiscarius]